MKSARRLFSIVLDRRGLCSSIAGLAVGAIAAKLPLGAVLSPETAIEDPEYLIVNGWVLTRNDVAAMGLQPDAIRLQ